MHSFSWYIKCFHLSFATDCAARTATTAGRSRGILGAYFFESGSGAQGTCPQCLSVPVSSAGFSAAWPLARLPLSTPIPSCRHKNICLPEFEYRDEFMRWPTATAGTAARMKCKKRNKAMRLQQMQKKLREKRNMALTLHHRVRV